MFCPSQLWQYGEHKPLSPSWLYPLVPESHLTQYLDNQQVNWNSGPWGLAQVVKGWSGFVGGSWWKRQKKKVNWNSKETEKISHPWWLTNHWESYWMKSHGFPGLSSNYTKRLITSLKKYILMKLHIVKNWFLKWKIKPGSKKFRQTTSYK